MKTYLSLVVVVPFSAVLASACYRNPDNTPPGVVPPGATPAGATSLLQDRLQKLDADLKVGDVGPNVRTVHDYLATYGYYPNADLAAEFPAWRPRIANAPQDPNVFDQKTADAVRQLQVNYGLSPTGIVDGPTRAAMLKPRCGVPDGIPRLDPSNKFAYGGSGQWHLQMIPIQLIVSIYAGVTLSQMTTATSQASSTWGGATALQFTVTASQTDAGPLGVGGSSGAGGGRGSNLTSITVQFGGGDGPGNKLAQTVSSGSNILITLDAAESWSTITPTPSNAIDVQSVVLHELGHAIGLGHSGIMGFSGVAGAVMFPLLAHGAQNRALAQDDRLAVRPLYDTYVQAPGGANDIGAGTDGSVWIIGTAPGAGGFTIYKWNGTGWDLDSGGSSTAVRISVSPDGSPWVVNNRGDVWHKSSNSPFSGVWQLVPGIAASDIAASGATAWAVSTTPVAGGFQVYYFDGQHWVNNDGTRGAVRIAVDDSGIPWILDASGAILIRYEGGWTSMPLGTGGSGAVDIAIPPGAIAGYAWAVNNRPGPQLILTLFDQQFSYPGPPGLDAPFVTQWWTTPFLSRAAGATASVAAAGPSGQPWIVDGAGNIFRSTIQ